jgi:sugar/nucleoside kinase (ribokinase family)
VVSLLEGRPYEEALRRSCIAGAYTAALLGAQRSLPYASDLETWLKAM